MSEPSDQNGWRRAEWRNWAGDERCAPAAIVLPDSVEEVSRRAGARAPRGPERARRGRRALVQRHRVQRRAAAQPRPARRACSTSTARRGLVRAQAGITIRELSRQLGHARPGDGEPRRHRRAEHRRRDLDGDARHRRAAAATSPRRSRADARARGRLDARVLAGARSRDASRGARRARLARRDRRGDACAACPRSRCAASTRPRRSATCSSASRSSRSGNDHFEFFVFPHASTALTRTNNRTTQPPRPRGARRRVRQRRAADEPRLRAVLPRRAALSWPDPADQPARDAAGRALRARRALRRHLRQPAPRALHRDGVRAAARAHPDWPCGGCSRSWSRRDSPSRFRSRSGRSPPDDAFLSTAAGRDSGFVAVHMYAGMQWEPYFRAVEQIMDEFEGRPHWGKRHFQTAAQPALALPRLGPLPGGARAARPRRALRESLDRSRASEERRPASVAEGLMAELLGTAATGRQPVTRARAPASDEASYARLERATAGLEAPFALVDLDAFWTNAEDLERRAGAQADPAGQQVGAVPRRCRSGCSSATASAARSPTRCPRRCGSQSTVSRTSWSPIRRPTGSRCARSSRGRANRSR